MTSIAERYQEQGYVFPLAAFPASQALEWRNQLEAAEAKFGGHQSFREVMFGSANFALPFVDRITRLPSILDPVREILGPDLIVWGAGFFTKEPQSSQYISWHQDLTYWGLSDVQEVTAWVALSESSEVSGCMRFVPGSHKSGKVPHQDTFEDDNLLTRGQVISVDVDESGAVPVELQPGQYSLHHGRIFHASNCNRSDDRRIGLAIRYITPVMHQTSGEKPFAHLVSGEDREQNFKLLSPTTTVMNPEYIKAYQHNMRVQQQDLFAGAENKGKRAIPAPAASTN